MWWKILIAVACGVLLISPIDLASGLPIDDIVYGLGMVSTIISTVNGLKGKKAKSADADVNDVSDN